MNKKEEALLQGVKLAVAKYGLSGFSTRNVAKLSYINDANIYRFFTSKEDLLLKAYEYESDHIFKFMMVEIDRIHDLQIPFDEKTRLCFLSTWNELLSDRERLMFCVFYYHSQYFKDAEEFHKFQLKELKTRLCKYFKSDEICIQILYAMFTVLYDSTYSVACGQVENTHQHTEQVYVIEKSIMGKCFLCPGG